MKIDLWDLLWKPRLVVASMASAVATIGKKTGERGYLPMEEHDIEHGYPRPQWKRDSFFSLDGRWEFSIATGRNKPLAYPYSVIVPFPPQVKRSGFMGRVPETFWYRRKFTLPKDFIQERLILHFGAVDQVATVFINGKKVCHHEGGYLPFSVDITQQVMADSENIIEVYVIDRLDPKYPYGKQVHKPGGMWYQQISGIWQSVWMESVPKHEIKSVGVCWDNGELKLNVAGASDQYNIRIQVPGERAVIIDKTLHNGENILRLGSPQLWSPENPNLYYYTITTEDDKVESYFAIRTISIEKVNGRQRICLNNKPYFFHGVLDQGYFSDGVFTPPSYKYYEQDILRMKELGFNTLRKHLKVEPARFYYDCDRLGMFVFQDMVNNGSYNYLRDTIMPTIAPFYVGHRKKDNKIKVSKETKAFFVKHSADTIRYLRDFPSIVYYTIFNEGWGQFESDRVLSVLKKIDPTRIYDSTSGWYVQNDSDVDSVHVYFHKVPMLKIWKKPIIVSEFGGFAYKEKCHSSYLDKQYGYGTSKNAKHLTKRIVKMYEEEIIPCIKKGICGTIYTQLSDVEEEINGLYTYDRQVCKVLKRPMQELARKLYNEIEKC